MKPREGLLLLLVCVAWGLHMVIIKWVTGYVSPLTYVAFRMPILALCLLPMLRWYPGQMLQIMIAAACFGGINYAFMFTGISLTNASIGSIVAESYVIFATIMSVVFLGEKVGWKRGSGIATALIGVLIIATGDGSVATAKKEGGITNVASIDVEVSNILGFIGEYCTVVRGN